jgi:hypothetical protein
VQVIVHIMGIIEAIGMPMPPIGVIPIGIIEGICMLGIDIGICAAGFMSDILVR